MSEALALRTSNRDQERRCESSSLWRFRAPPIYLVVVTDDAAFVLSHAKGKFEALGKTSAQKRLREEKVLRKFHHPWRTCLLHYGR